VHSGILGLHKADMMKASNTIRRHWKCSDPRWEIVTAELWTLNTKLPSIFSGLGDMKKPCELGKTPCRTLGLMNNSTLINNALKTWSFDQDANKAYIARTTFLKAKVFEASGRSQKATVALKVASRLRQDITKERREPASLTVEHFDSLITFWGQ